MSWLNFRTNFLSTKNRINAVFSVAYFDKASLPSLNVCNPFKFRLFVTWGGGGDNTILYFDQS